MVIEFSDNQIRQAVDAEAAFLAWRDARRAAQEVRGTMFWREQSGRQYLIRRSTTGGQTSLGPRSLETEALFERFTARKSSTESREKALRERLEEHRRMNRALGLGRMSSTVVDVLSALDSHGLADQFRVVGTHALFAYAAAARVHLSADATATQDVDLLFDMRRRVKFVRTMAAADKSLLQVIRSADSTFELRPDQLYTAANARGFEVDVIRRVATGEDPYPMRMSEAEDDFWAAQVDSGDRLQDGGLMNQVVIATNGAMALMRTVSPGVFCKVKLAVASNSDRDPGKARRDRAQADLVRSLVANYLPQWREGLGDRPEQQDQDQDGPSLGPRA
ncbi:MAG: hypothetical protein HKL99_14025 [Burkholderiales bacterium]|nr:hypothetical protein [Burkholderiales bacterium]